MIVEIPLESVANQRFTALLDGYNYDIRLVDVRGLMMADISRDNEVVITSLLCVPGLLIPYPHMEAGNFYWSTEDEDYPDWRVFGDTQRLFFLSGQELDDVRQSTA